MGEPFAGLAPRTVWGVQALLLAAGDSLAARFGALSVQGELGSFTRSAQGHCYFSLKDAEGAAATLRCAMFRRAASLLDFEPRESLQVELRGRLAVYEARGELQFVVEAMRQLGAGNLYEAFLRLRARLEAEGLFAPERKRPITSEPRAVGVVTSPTAAALHDVLTALRRRAPHVRVVIYPSPVQGTDAPARLVRALQEANRRAEVDTLLLVRGGGSLEDLWAFNDEALVRAVAASTLPVICGVGHETDLSLCDLAADLRAPTPTAAAELAAPAREEQLQECAARARALRHAAQALLRRHGQRLDQAAVPLFKPALVVAAQSQRLRGLAERLRLGLRASLGASGQALQRHEAALQALDPARVLTRGYAWVEDEAGRAVLNAAAVQTGQLLTTVWSDGRARSRVEGVQTLRQPLPRDG